MWKFDPPMDIQLFYIPNGTLIHPRTYKSFYIPRGTLNHPRTYKFASVYWNVFIHNAKPLKRTLSRTT